MKLLALDTSTEACSAALFIDGEIRQRFEITPKAHTKLLLPMIESLLAEAELKLSQLDALAFGCGPGSFTGLRIATGVVQGLAFGADLPIVPVSTLAALAQNRLPELAFVATDARIGEIFGVFINATPTALWNWSAKKRFYRLNKLNFQHNPRWEWVQVGAFTKMNYC